jgi:hypothetical protein
MKALEMTLLPEVSAHFKTTNGWAVKFMQQRGLHIHQRITLVQELPKGYLQ